MDPVDLSEEELAYELKIRGVSANIDRRAGTRALRNDLEDESKGLMQSPTKQLPPLPAEEHLSHLKAVVGGLLNETEGAIVRKDIHAGKILYSKLHHYKGRVNRLAGTNPADVIIIESMQNKLCKAIALLEDRAMTTTAGGKAGTHASTGAVPKQPVAARRTPPSTAQQPDSIGEIRNDPQTVNLIETNDNEVDLEGLVNAANAITFEQRNTERMGNNDLNFMDRNNEGFVGHRDHAIETIPLQRNETFRHFEENDRRVSGNRQQFINANNYSQNHRENNFQQRYENNNFQQDTNARGGRPSQIRGPYMNANLYENGREQNTQMRAWRGRNPVAEWNITFSGDNKETSLNDFLSQVTLMARAERVADNDLLASAIYLFTGSAKIWYRAFYPYYRTWNELVAGLKTQFLPVDYDFWLVRELEQRRQGEHENFGIFFASMEMLFRNLSYRMNEQQKLNIVMRNMLPMYAERLALEEVNSLTQLASKCKRIEEVRYRIGRQTLPQIQRRDLLEPAFSHPSSNVPRHRVFEAEVYEGPDYVQVAEISNPRQKINLCYNCGNAGHRFNQCQQERTLFCYRCGLTGCVTRNCRRCQGNFKGNAHASSAQGAAMSSQETQTPNNYY